QDSIMNLSSLLEQQPHSSLRQLFRLLLDNELDLSNFSLQPIHLKLLLYPLQILAFQHCQLTLCFSDELRSTTFSKSVTETSSILRFEEIQSLLQRWREIFDRQTTQGTRGRVI